MRVLRWGAAAGVAIALGGGVISCRHPEPPPAPKQVARADMLVSPAWLGNHLDDPNVIVVHVARDRATYDTVHIPGARFVGWKEVAVTRDGLPNELPPLADLVAMLHRLGVTRTSRVVVYSEDAGLMAARAYVAFAYAGLADRTALLDGQWRAWPAEGRPVTAAVPTVQSSDYTPRFDPDVVVTRRQVADIVWSRGNCGDQRFALIDARPAAQYAGTDPGEEITRPGHIPGAVSIPWMKDVVSDSQPVLRSPDELRAVLRVLAVPPVGATIVAYCRTGAQASHTYFTMRYLGYDVRLYDGSYIDWSADSTLPVVAPSDTLAKSASSKGSCGG